jgi:hypothetical protein
MTDSPSQEGDTMTRDPAQHDSDGSTGAKSPTIDAPTADATQSSEGKPAEDPQTKIPEGDSSSDGEGDGGSEDDDSDADADADADADSEDDDDDDDEDDDEEPQLTYTRLTDKFGSCYRNGDATSSFLVAGDKMVHDAQASCFNA